MTPCAAEVRELADGVVAYVQGDGSWGLSNAGLVVGDNDCLLVDTLFDLAHTRRMLDALRRFTRRDDDANVVVNTHANGDHCYGNVLLKDRRIIASRRAGAEMRDMPATKLATLMKAARFVTGLGSGRAVIGRLLGALGLSSGADFMDAAPYVLEAFSPFEFSGIEPVLPTDLFEGQLELDLGGKRVQLMELGPAHTAGDVAAFVPETGTLFAGDLLFEGMHPLVWSGTIGSYIAALEHLLALEPQVVVPGHGAVTDRLAIGRHLDYLHALRQEAEPLYASGATPEQAARGLMARGFGSSRHPERLAVNVAAAYREFRGQGPKNDVIRMFGAMARLAKPA